MNANQAQTAMHTSLDSEFSYVHAAVTQAKSGKLIISQERDVSYRFHLHSHPFVHRLVDRTLTGGTGYLQAADTEYDPDGRSLPQSVEITLGAGAELNLPAGAELVLQAGATCTLPSGPMALTSGTVVHSTAAATVVATAGAHATLVAGMLHTPADGAEVTLPAQPAYLSADTQARLKAATSVVLVNGEVGTLPAGTVVFVTRGTEFPLAANTHATVVRSAPLPLLWGPVLDRYGPSALVQRPYPMADLDFTSSGAYSIYNWEVFFHAPLTLAVHLSRNQHYAEAQRWFHYLFDPTDDSDGPTPERFWKVRPFQTTDVKRAEEILVNLATGADTALLADTLHSIAAWQQKPFRPHVVAGYRPQAYMFKTVMAYLDNLIDWGDSLFRQDTGEAIDEALMLYMLAAGILGPRPEPVPTKGTVRPQTYHNLRNDLQKFGVVMREVEVAAPFDLMPLPDSGSSGGTQAGAVRSLGKALYFGVPRNDKLMGYWATVEDRLFKIRNSLNLQGVFRQLALFEPPIDPALLARAAASGLDVGAIVNGLNQPLPLVRFQLQAQKAAEIAQEVRTLGAGLLSAMEKEDGEAMVLLRAKHERVVMEMAEQVKLAQLQEAIKSKEALRESLANAVHRFAFYERQLGRTDEEIAAAVPEHDELETGGQGALPDRIQEATMGRRDLPVNIAPELLAQASGSPGAGKLLSSFEVLEADYLQSAHDESTAAGVLNLIASVAALVPQFEISAEPWGIGGGATFGGQQISTALNAAASVGRLLADQSSYNAQRAGRTGGYARRELEWVFQSNQAAGEINLITRQLRAAEIRQAVAELELGNHRQQMRNATEIEQFLNAEGVERAGKRTNKALYTWMKREVKGLYAQSFQLAFDVARKAERSLQHELGDTSLTYLQYGYLSGKEGLLAGERLHLDLKRMEVAYLELNRREYELTKHVSLRQVDPQALIQLRATGRCTVQLDEHLFNFDGPSHYFRRIKNVALSIPSVTGPYAGVNCTLTLLRSSIRTSPVVGERPYVRESSEDDRFSDYFGSMQSIVTSSAMNDAGMFETNLRDERYLPFEHSGVISQWQLQLPANPSLGEPMQFDYDSISDVVLHLRYTAREGGETLRRAAMDDLKARIDAAEALGSVRLFSLPHDFPVAWAAYRAAAEVDGYRQLAITLLPAHYPIWAQPGPGVVREVKAADLIVRGAGQASVAAPDGTSPDVLGALFGDFKMTRIQNAPMPPFTGPWQVGLTSEGVEEAWLLIHWGTQE